MSDYDHPVYERPRDGRVLNPSTENWVKQSYAQKIGILKNAKRKTAEFYREKEEEAREAAEKAAERISQSEDSEEKESLNSQVEPDEEGRENLDETARVQYDEAGQEHRVDHGDSAEEKSPDEALENIMNDIDSGGDFDGEEFVDTDAAEPDMDAPPKPGAEGEEVEDYEPENVDIPTFPGGIYSTKSQKEKQKKQEIKDMTDDSDPSKRADTEKAGKNKRYEHTDSGGIRVIYEDEEDSDKNE